jgi:hypothetical protein
MRAVNSSPGAASCQLVGRSSATTRICLASSSVRSLRQSASDRRNYGGWLKRHSASRGLPAPGGLFTQYDGARLRVGGPPRLSQDTQRFGVSRRATSQSSPQRRAGGLLASAGVSPSRWPPASSCAPSRPPLEVAVRLASSSATRRLEPPMPRQRRSTRPGRRARAASRQRRRLGARVAAELQRPPPRARQFTGRVNRLAPPRRGPSRRGSARARLQQAWCWSVPVAHREPPARLINVKAPPPAPA